MGFEKLTKLADPLMELSHHGVGAVTTEDVRFGQRRGEFHLARISHDELSRLDRLLFGIRTGNSTSFNRGVAYSVLESEGLPLRGQGIAVLAPDHGDAA